MHTTTWPRTLALVCASIALVFLGSATSKALAISYPIVTFNGEGWEYEWDENATFEARSQLVTSVGGTFSGSNVGTLVGADTFYNAGITGQNTISSNIEAGHIWNAHESLTHVTSLTNAVGVPGGTYVTPAFDRHATWVGMMIGGRNRGAFPGPWQTGIAPATDLRSGAIATSWNGASYALGFGLSVSSINVPYTSATAGFGTADVINSSWGGSGTNSAEGRDFLALIIDSQANENPVTTFVSSAGNTGPGTNTVGSPGSGYNGITVGALQNNGADVYNSVASFSSRGPQAYGDPVNGNIPAANARRAAVDIAAPGTTLTSAFYGGQTGGNDPNQAGSAPLAGIDLYQSGRNGTSFAAPIVAGGVSLMKSASKAMSLPATSLDSRVVKAAMLNAADKIPGWTNGQAPHPNGNGGVRTNQALDFNTGAGALNLDQTYTQYLMGQTDIPGVAGGTTTEVIGWDYGEVGIGGTTDVVIDQDLVAGSTFTATLSWFRDRDYISSTNFADLGFADLELEIWDSTFTTLYSQSISTFTPVEHVTFPLPVRGKYGLRVNYIGNVFGNINSEEFGLAWSAVAVPEPSSVAMALLGLLGAVAARWKLGGIDGVSS